MLSAFRRLGAYNELIIACAAIAIVMLIVIPIPPVFLDMLLAFSFAFAAVIFLATLFIEEPLQLSVFPTLLLIATLYRLALNITSTRLILGQAYAGEIIQAFGEFVVGGNYLVGFIVFLIITIIQFVVITNGAGRVAEVAARFTLDAMPGKQMAIDADLNSGLIGEAEARERRKRLQLEADFYGAMDGASKFVRGDAIAGVVITLINILGGFGVGVWQHKMDFSTALSTYTLLTVGDGLVTQIPALLVSTGTGILVTRASGGRSFTREVSSQVTSFPRVIALTSGVLLALALVPGLPTLPFLVLAGGTGFFAYALIKESRQAEGQAQLTPKQVSRQPENVAGLLKVDPLEIEIGYGLISLTDEAQGGDLLDRLAAVRRQCATELGILVRPVRVRDNLQLLPNAYVFKIRGVEAARGELMPRHYLAMMPGETPAEPPGVETKEPAFGLRAWWVAPEAKGELELKGYTVVDSTTVLITHFLEFIKAHAADILGRQEVREMLDAVREQYAAVVDELVPNIMTVGEVQKVLQNLLRERVPIRDLVGILEVLADHARLTKDLDYLTEVSRQALHRTISRLYASPEGKIHGIILHPGLEQAVAESIQPTREGNYPVLEPDKARAIFEQVKEYAEKAALQGIQPVILCSSRIRLPFRRMAERFIPNLPVIAYTELSPDLKIEALGTVVLK